MKTFAICLVLLLSWACVESNDPAVACVQDQCTLPNCYCSSTNVPPGVTDITEYPQIVMLSFDDAVEKTLYDQFYSPLFQFVNKNGCNIGLTFFLSHDYAEYDLVHDLWQRGHEIASHSISHQTPTDYWKNLDYNGWVNEMYGLKEIASTFANIPMADIIGTRAPFLQGGGDVMLQALADNLFQYDCTEPTLIYTNPPLYPYTFDFRSIQDCEIPPCPQNSYPGFWEVPLVDFNTTNGFPCAMLDSCTGVTGNQSTYDFLKYNFDIHYSTNRAPIGYFTHASWFLTDPTHYPGYLNFISYLQTLPDVYIVTVKNAIEWMKNPTKTVDIANFVPWQCANLPTSPCTPQTCHYVDVPPGGERYMKSCVQCSKNYPWIGDPFGNNTTP